LYAFCTLPQGHKTTGIYTCQGRHSTGKVNRALLSHPEHCQHLGMGIHTQPTGPLLGVTAAWCTCCLVYTRSFLAQYMRQMSTFSQPTSGGLEVPPQGTRSPASGGWKVQPKGLEWATASVAPVFLPCEPPRVVEFQPPLQWGPLA
jgi:hypothetical protein